MDVQPSSLKNEFLGSFQGAFNSLAAHDLGSVAIKEVLTRANLNGSDIDEVILGQALQAGQGQNPARQAALKAGLPIETSAYGLNMLCGSGLKSVSLGFQSIRNGDSKIVIAGGQESMTSAPHSIYMRGTKMGNSTALDTLLHDGLTDAMNKIHMGETAEALANLYKISREAQDQAALSSQHKAEAAQKAGFFKEEIVPVSVPGREVKIIDKDEYIRLGATIEGLTKLRPCFVKGGTVTAGNASGINDSAAAVLIASGEEVTKRNLKPLAKIVAFAQTGCDPKIMGIGKRCTRSYHNLSILIGKCIFRSRQSDSRSIEESWLDQRRRRSL